MAHAIRGQKLGSALAIDAARRAAHADPAIYALVDDAKDHAAASFYTRLAFQPFVSRPGSFYLPVATAIHAFRIALQ